MSLFRNKKGFALILTIMIVSLLVALTIDFNEGARSDLTEATNFSEAIVLDSMARSGYEYCLAVLHEDGLESDFDASRESWANPAALASGAGALFDEGELRVSIIDHSGRININKLIGENGEYDEFQKGLLKRFLSLEEFNLNEEDIGNILDAIKDWIDRDDEVTRFGAERSYYMSLENSYFCRNGPIETLEELLLVRGLTRGLIYGGEVQPGILRFLTIYGDGKININTADPIVIRSLSDQIDQEMAEELISYRQKDETDLGSPTWYKDVPGMSGVEIAGELIKTSSAFFEIQSMAAFDKMKKSVTGQVERKGGKFDIKYWKIE